MANKRVRTSREQDVVLIHTHRVDNRILPLKVLHKGPLGTLPLLDAPRAPTRKRKLGRMNGQRANALLVMGEHPHGLAGGEIPQPDRRIERCSDNLWICLLALKVRDRAGMARENMDVAAGAHVPHTSDTIPTSSDEDIERRMQSERINTTEVAMVVADNFVGLQIPALDHFVLTAREEVWMTRRHCEAAHGADVSGQRQAEGTRGQIPDLDSAVSRAAGEPFVAGLDSQGAHPAEVAGDDSHQLPWWMPLGFLLLLLEGAATEAAGVS